MNSTEGTVRPLEGLRVLEIEPSVSASYAGLLFAQAGAHVTTVITETADDSSLETEVAQWRRIERAYLDDGKSAVMNGGATALAEVAAAHHVIVTGPGFDWDRLALPGGSTQITATIYPYGRTGPYAHWVADELVLAALGSATEFTVDEQGTPIGGYGRRYQYMAGTYAYDVILAVLLSEATAKGARHPRIEVSELETVVSMLGYSTTQFAYNGAVSIVGQAGPRYTVRCSDGHIVLGASGSWPPIATLLGRADLLDDPRFLTQGARYGHAEELGDMVEEWVAGRTVAEARALAETLSVPVIGVARGTDLLADELLADRGAWERVAVAGLGEGLAPRPPYILDGRRVGRIAHGA